MRKFASTKQKWLFLVWMCNSNNWGLLAFGVCLIKAKKENYECDLSHIGVIMKVALMLR